MRELRGCSDGGCIIQRPEGMHTNGGCNCERELRHALGVQGSRRFIDALRERQREVAELREAAIYARSAVGDWVQGIEPRPDVMAKAYHLLDAALEGHAQDSAEAK